MRVRVLFFGILKDIAGKASEEVSLPEGATVRDLLSHYAQDARLQGMLRSIAVSLNQEYAAAGGWSARAGRGWPAAAGQRRRRKRATGHPITGSTDQGAH